MKIDDIVYGPMEVEEPVLIELIESPSMQRLKDISQFGVPDEFNSRKGYPRYEHGVGVMLLLKKLDAPLEEQVSGLLHDVSVLAFSHVTDWIFGKGRTGDEGYHDSIHEEFISQTEIPEILEKYGYSVERIADEHQFPLLEREIPELCADRVDYSLRELAHGFDTEAASACLPHIVPHEGEISFDDEDAAFLFSTRFLDLQNENWGSDETVRRYHLFAKVMEDAVNEGLLEEGDFWKDESHVLGKLGDVDKPDMHERLEFLRNDPLPEDERIDGTTVKKKFRHVNPNVLGDSGTIRLTELRSDYAELLEENRRFHEKGVDV